MNFDILREYIPMNVVLTGMFLLLLQFTLSSKGVGNIQLKIHTRLNSFVSKLKSFSFTLLMEKVRIEQHLQINFIQ